MTRGRKNTSMCVVGEFAESGGVADRRLRNDVGVSEIGIDLSLHFPAHRIEMRATQGAKSPASLGPGSRTIADMSVGDLVSDAVPHPFVSLLFRSKRNTAKSTSLVCTCRRGNQTRQSSILESGCSRMRRFSPFGAFQVSSAAQAERQNDFSYA